MFESLSVGLGGVRVARTYDWAGGKRGCGLGSAQREGTRIACWPSSGGGRSDFFRGLFVGAFEFRQVGVEFLDRGPVHQVEAEHLVRAFGRFAAGPEGDQQAGDDRTVGLDFDAVLAVTEQVAAAE